jgi:CDP-diacylglycerol--serine O-phosphatidyltransferase
MTFLYDKYNHFNLANLFTFVNITMGSLAVYFITKNEFTIAIILIWIGGAFDIFDGKIARKYKLSTEFGVQLDSFADFLSFVLVPVFLVFQAIFSIEPNFIIAMILIYYIIAGLRRLIQFNINADAGEIEKYFTGIPTPLGGILLWLVYLAFAYGIITNHIILITLIALIAYLLNSKLKIRHL